MKRAVKGRRGVKRPRVRADVRRPGLGSRVDRLALEIVELRANIRVLQEAVAALSGRLGK